MNNHPSPPSRPSVAVIGSGISGLSAAWLLSHRCAVTLYEKDDRPGGHSNTVITPDGPVDTGFIVYNEKNYPNLTALFRHFQVDTAPSDMSFGVGLSHAGLVYAGRDLAGLFVQKKNLWRPAFLRMVYDLLRFYRQAPQIALSDEVTLGDFLTAQGYSRHFIDWHIIPMGAAIWSSPAHRMLDYPLRAFVDFCRNHGLLQLRDRPQWRTVCGGARCYVEKMLSAFADNGGRLVLNSALRRLSSADDRVCLETRTGQVVRHDHAVLATHADQALSLLAAPSPQQQRVLSAFAYHRNKAILHTDTAFMPRSRKAWCSWNYHDGDEGQLCLTYWMNALQPLRTSTDYFVTLNPAQLPRDGTIVRSFLYDHPLYDAAAVQAQKNLWAIQGQNRVWLCGSYFGAGFHEDGLQAGLAVAEALGGHPRPWSVPRDSNRVNLPDGFVNEFIMEAAQ